MSVEPARIGAVAAADVVSTDFDAYVAARGRDLYRTAYLLTGDHHRAEDLVQTALAKAWPRWGQITQRSDPPVHAYVRRIVTTTYIAWWRRRWNGEQPTAQLPERAGSPPDAADRAAGRRDLMRALAHLPRGQRAVIVLRYFDDLSETQTAEALGCSVGSVKTQTSRALAKLRADTSLLADGGQP